MAFATNKNLHDWAPDVFDHGVDDWTDELGYAEDDVANNVKANYYAKHHNSRNFEKSKLTETQWTKAAVYRALSAYILPKLATFRIDDVFQAQIAFYKERYAEEMDLQFKLGIEYDTNDDGTVQDGEITEYNQGRLYR